MKDKIEKKLKRMNKELNALLQDLRGYSNERLNQSPAQGAWSVVQVLSHLFISESKSLSYIQKKSQYAEGLMKNNLGSKARSLLLRFYLQSPLKYKAPPMVDTQGREEQDFWELAKGYTKMREELESFLENLPEEQFKQQIYRHPIAGRVSISAMLDFFYDHFKRHRKQIYRTLRNIDAVKIQ